MFWVYLYLVGLVLAYPLILFQVKRTKVSDHFRGYISKEATYIRVGDLFIALLFTLGSWAAVVLISVTLFLDTYWYEALQRLMNKKVF